MLQEVKVFNRYWNKMRRLLKDIYFLGEIVNKKGEYQCLQFHLQPIEVIVFEGLTVFFAKRGKKLMML